MINHHENYIVIHHHDWPFSDGVEVAATRVAVAYVLHCLWGDNSQWRIWPSYAARH
jgi:hypothetical protein